MFCHHRGPRRNDRELRPNSRLAARGIGLLAVLCGALIGLGLADPGLAAATTQSRPSQDKRRTTTWNPKEKINSRQYMALFGAAVGYFRFRREGTGPGPSEPPVNKVRGKRTRGGKSKRTQGQLLQEIERRFESWDQRPSQDTIIRHLEEAKVALSSLGAALESPCDESVAPELVRQLPALEGTVDPATQQRVRTLIKVHDPGGGLGRAALRVLKAGHQAEDARLAWRRSGEGPEDRALAVELLTERIKVLKQNRPKPTWRDKLEIWRHQKLLADALVNGEVPGGLETELPELLAAEATWTTRRNALRTLRSWHQGRFDKISPEGIAGLVAVVLRQASKGVARKTLALLLDTNSRRSPLERLEPAMHWMRDHLIAETILLGALGGSALWAAAGRPCELLVTIGAMAGVCVGGLVGIVVGTFADAIVPDDVVERLLHMAMLGDRPPASPSRLEVQAATFGMLERADQKLTKRFATQMAELKATLTAAGQIDSAPHAAAAADD